MFDFGKFLNQNEEIIAKSIAVGAVGGILFLLFKWSMSLPPPHSYSLLYIKPYSYPSCLRNAHLEFVYGVESHENRETEYKLSIYAGEKLLDEKYFNLSPKVPQREEKLSYTLPAQHIAFPLKVRIVLETLSSDGESYEVFYVLRGECNL